MKRAIAALMAMVLVPLLIGSLLLLVRQAQEETEATKDQLQALARTLAEAVDRELDRGSTQLQVIAASPPMDGADWASLYEFGRKIAERTPGSLFALVDESGQMLFNTTVQPGQPLPNVWNLAQTHQEVTWHGKRLPVTTQDLTREVFRAGRTVYSDLFYGINTQRPMLAIVEPVFRGKAVRYAVAFSFPPAALHQVLSAIPPHFRALLVDRHDIVIAASEGAVVTLGDRAAPIGAAPGAMHGFYQIGARDGQQVFGAYVVSPRTGFTVRVSLPRDDTAILARAASRDWALFVFAAVTIAVAVAGALARRLTGPLERLGQAARSGILPEGGNTGIVEIDVLAAALRAGVQAEHGRYQEQLLRIRAERKEEVLKASETRLKQVLEQLFVYVAVLDDRGRVLEVNSTALSSSGLRREDVVGAEFWECWWWQHDRLTAERVHVAVASALGAQPIRFDCQAQFRDGEVRTVDLQVAPLQQVDGRVESVIASGVDIEDRVRAMAALRQADGQKDEFIATLAHELRNPLAPIRTSVEVLRRSQVDQRVADRAIGIIDRQCAHLARIVDDLLDVSRITRGKVHLRREPLDLAALALNTLESFEEQFLRAGISLRAKVDPGIFVEGDATRLAQCIGNLLGNALKFTPRDGEVELSLRAETGHAVLELSDNGAGISPAHIDRIFELFAQEQRSGSHGHSGLGIGLALTRKLIELHAGTISAASAGPGQGSVFRVDLPLAAAPIGKPASGQNAPTPRSARILVVDDNRDAADSLSELLAMSGYTSQVAYDGQAALHATSQRAFDVVLLDLGLPDISGYEVCRRIRERTGPQPLIIALTGWGQERDTSATARAGFDGHLVKPIELQSVLSTVASALAKEETGPARG